MGNRTMDRAYPFFAASGLRRADAARYVGVSATTFDRLVKEGVMPRPRDQSGIMIWLRHELDDTLFALPVIGDKGDEGGRSICDQAFGV